MRGQCRKLGKCYYVTASTISWILSVFSYIGVGKLFLRVRINILGFVSHMAMTTQLCCCSLKVIIDNVQMNGFGCIFTHLYLQNSLWTVFVSCTVVFQSLSYTPSSFFKGLILVYKEVNTK